jgi:hypothetical protein
MRLPSLKPWRTKELKMKCLTAAFVVGLLSVGLSQSEVRSDPPESSGFNIAKYGAKGNGEDKDTAAIQSAIDACRAKGGGTVYFPPGKYLCGSLHLRSNISLYVDHGAMIVMSPDNADFDPYEKLDFKNAADNETSFFHHALIWGEDLDRVAILGTGTIDGNRKKRGGPKPIALKRCRHVKIKDITITDSPNYCISLLGTDYVDIDSVTILNGYADGIDPDCCHHVRIAGCHIESWDDAIVPKASFSLGHRRSTENLTVTNCVLATNCNAFKLGTESGGDFRNIAVSNCVFFDRPHMRPPRAGIALLSVDGSHLEGVTISNIVMSNVAAPVFLRLGNRGRDLPTPLAGTLRNVTISNIVATGASQAWPITGIPYHKIEDVTLSDIRITFRDQAPAATNAPSDVLEQIAKYPDPGMFGVLPAYGFYCRHVAGLKLANIHVQGDAYERRHALVCEDVSDLVVDGFAAKCCWPLRFAGVRDALVRGCMPGPGTNVFLKVADGSCSGITLFGNDFSRTRTVYELNNNTAKQTVTELYNRK